MFNFLEEALDEVALAVERVIAGDLRGRASGRNDRDRTLFFDFLSLNTKTLPGFTTRFQLYTVPGQAIYNTTRQLVLKGVDGIVFVVDSHWDKMADNVESFANLQENLIDNHLSLAQIPYVLQYNKRDLPNAAPVNYLDNAEMIAVYLNAAFESGDTSRIAEALGDVARARGMTKISKATGLAREQLYKTLSAEGKPELSTVLKVMAAFGGGLKSNFPRAGVKRDGRAKAALRGAKPRKVA